VARTRSRIPSECYRDRTACAVLESVAEDECYRLPLIDPS